MIIAALQRARQCGMATSMMFEDGAATKTAKNREKPRLSERPQNKHLRRTAGPGRPKGTPNRVTREVREVALNLVTNLEYLAGVRKRLASGRAGTLETVIWYYAYGKPRETVDLNINPRKLLAELLGIAEDELPGAGC